MNQPIPDVNRDDVERIVRREFTPDQYDTAMTLLDEYGHEEWHRERYRVQLAVLKLAGGRLDALRQGVETAKCDYRDVLAYAEYPAYMRKAIRTSQLPTDEERRIINEDSRQYDNWLNR